MHHNWACRLGGWLLWGSLGALLAVIGLLEAMFLLAPVEGSQEFVWRFLLRPGFALVPTTFLLGVGCHLVEGRIGRQRGGRL